VRRWRWSLGGGRDRRVSAVWREPLPSGERGKMPTSQQVDDESLNACLSASREDALVAFGTDAERAPFSLLMSELTETMESRDVAPLRVVVREGRVDIDRGTAPPPEVSDAPDEFTWRLDRPAT
jgi:hypothetical protein